MTEMLSGQPVETEDHYHQRADAGDAETRERCRHDHSYLIDFDVLPNLGEETRRLGICLICPRERRYRELSRLAKKTVDPSRGGYCGREARCPV